MVFKISRTDQYCEESETEVHDEATDFLQCAGHKSFLRNNTYWRSDAEDPPPVASVYGLVLCHYLPNEFRGDLDAKYFII